MPFAVRLGAIAKFVAYVEMSVHGPVALVVDHCARIWSGPVDVLESDQVFTPAVNVEMLATSVSAVLPSLVSTLDCAASHVLRGRVPKANTPFPTLTLYTV